MHRLYIFLSLFHLYSTLDFEIGCSQPVNTETIWLETRNKFLFLTECIRVCHTSPNCDVVVACYEKASCTTMDCPYISMPKKACSPRFAVNIKRGSYDDLFGISATTGSSTTTSSNFLGPGHTTSVFITEKQPEMCHGSHVDAFTKTSDGSLLAFSGSLVYKFASHGIEPGWPKLISEVFIGLPDNIDAALYNWNDKGYIYFFKGSKYWWYDDFNIETNYDNPRITPEGWPGLPCDTIDAAFVRYKNGKTYFIVGDKYYRFDDDDLEVDSGYPRSLRSWDSMFEHDTISATFQDNTGKNYFFGEDNFYEYNEDKDGVEDGFPLSTAKYWFGCEKTCPDYCGTHFDAFTRTSDHSIYGFAGSLVFKFASYGLAPGWPRPISEVFKGLPNDIDAALYNWNNEGKIHFFKGDMCWTFIDFEEESTQTNPLPINQMWGGLPMDVNAAFVRKKYGRAYFIKGDEYYRVSNDDKDLSSGYPKHISKWDPILAGANIVAALQDNIGITYFFGRDKFYKYDEDSDSVADRYPLPISTHWLRCSC